MNSIGYLPALTSLRFVATSMIVVHHVAGYFGNTAGGLNHLALDQGVSFFFVLSGFILFYRHEELHNKGETWRFVAGRGRPNLAVACDSVHPHFYVRAGTVWPGRPVLGSCSGKFTSAAILVS
ncbi:MAG: acyltransferase family protein [Janthinobacterium lividum]